MFLFISVFKAVFVGVETTASYKSAQSDLWPLTSQGIFLHTSASHQIFSLASSLNPGDWCEVVKIPVDQHQLMLKWITRACHKSDYQQPCSPRSKLPFPNSDALFALSLHRIYTPECIDFLPCDWLIFVLTSSCTFDPIKWPVCIVKVWAFPSRVLSLRRASREGNGPTIFNKESKISVFSVLGLLLRCLRRNISTSGSLFPFSLQFDGHDRI